MADPISASAKRALARKRSLKGDRDGVVFQAFDQRSWSVEILERTKTALRSGGVLRSPYEAVVDQAKRCIQPVHIRSIGKPHITINGAKTVEHPTRTLVNIVQCRRCAPCLRERAYQWGLRAVSEYGSSSRTWFCSLTFAPAERYRLALLSQARLAGQDVDMQQLSGEDLFKALIPETNAEVTKYLKRLRSNDGKGKGIPLIFRFLLTVEPHKDWSPHYHLLVHEVSEMMPVTYTKLTTQWTMGISHFKLVNDTKAVFYVAKYLGKYSVARVHASKTYGRPPVVARAKQSATTADHE